MAGLLAASAGDWGDVGRLGGDEFLVVLPGAAAGAAGAAVDRLAAALAAYPGPARDRAGAPPPALGYSLGLAAALLARADRAMYAAKQRCGGGVRFLPAVALGDGRTGA